MAKAVQDCPFRIYRGELRRLEKGLERNKNIKYKKLKGEF